MLDKAIRIAAVAFEGKFDKGGQPYILHCLQVMNDTQTNDVEVKCAAVLHDLFEDCPQWNSLQLLKEGFSFRVIGIIAQLTNNKNLSYEDYIRAIGTNKDAALIKLADLRHNSQLTRLKDVRKKDFDRMQKYALAYRYLEGVYVDV